MYSVGAKANVWMRNDPKTTSQAFGPPSRTGKSEGTSALASEEDTEIGGGVAIEEIEEAPTGGIDTISTIVLTVIAVSRR